MGSMADAWFGKGWTEGQTEGLAKGKAELLERQLTRRFGRLSKDVRARLAQATAEELGSFAEAVLDANSLDDVLANGSGKRHPDTVAADPTDTENHAPGMQEAQAFGEMLTRVLRETGRDNAEDTVGALTAEYFDEGKAKGLMDGLAEGRAELLERQLIRRFGPLSEAGRTRIAQATSEELDGFAEAVLDAESSDDVLTNGTGKYQTFIDLQGIVSAQLSSILCCALTEFPKQVETLVRHRLPQAACALLTDDPFELVNSNFVDNRLNQYHVDRLALGRLRDGRDIYVAFAFKNGPAPGVVEHLARSQRLIQKRHPIQYPERSHSIVLPFVLYSGKQPWNIPHAATSEEEIMELFGRDPELRYLLLDAEREDPARAAPDAETQSVLMALTWDQSNTAQDLQKIFSGAEEHDWRGTQILHFLREAKEVSPELLEEGCFADWPHLNEVETLALVQRWEAMGQTEGLRPMLLEMLERFFGYLKTEMIEYIHDASPRELKHLTLAVRDANCIHDVVR